MAHCRGDEPKCSSARNFAFNQPTKCAQELLALRHHSVNATPESDREWNRCHCSVQSLINGTVPSLDRKQLTARYLEYGLYIAARLINPKFANDPVLRLTDERDDLLSL
jgi:hypothetical protein